LGHECLARVEAVGPGVTKFKPGDLAVPVVRRAHPGARHRVDMLAFGEFTERGIYSEHGFSLPRWIDRPEYLFPVPPALAEAAVLTEPLSVAEKGIHEALVVQRARLGDSTWSDPPPRVLVTGMGPIGFAALVGCRAREWPATMWGRDDRGTFRAQLAEAWGARYVAESSGALFPKNVEQDGFDLILECTGSDDVMVRSAQALRSRGVMIWLGSARRPEPRQHNVEALMRSGLLRNHLHIGSVNAAPRDFESALAHLARLLTTHRREVAALITHRVAPSEALWHYENRVPQGIKTVVMFE
jgi:threonine dehydrogenase-like Zn-dependent dehydrogenase